MAKKPLIKALSLIAAVLWLWGCSSNNDPLAGGGGTDWEARTVMGSAVYPDGTPAAGAIVVFLPDTFRAALPSAKAKTAAAPIAVVGDSGEFRIDSLSPGSYSMEIVDLRTGEPSKGAYRVVAIPEHDSVFVIDTAVLTATGSIRGTVDRAPVGTFAPVFVRIIGLNRIASVDTAGGFELRNLAAAQYALEVVSTESAVIPRSVPVAVVSDSIRTIPAITPFVDHVVDAVIVRSILDTLGLTEIPVTAVSSTRSGRVVDLNLSSYLIRLLPEAVGGLTMLQSLWVSGDSITTLPPAIGKLRELTCLFIRESGIESLPDEIGLCGKLRHLMVLDSRLSTLPDAIGDCQALDTMEINNNLISSLPESVTRLDGLTVLNISGNRICTPSDPVRAWLDRKMPGWEFNQTCE